MSRGPSSFVRKRALVQSISQQPTASVRASDRGMGQKYRTHSLCVPATCYSQAEKFEVDRALVSNNILMSEQETKLLQMQNSRQALTEKVAELQARLRHEQAQTAMLEVTCTHAPKEEIHMDKSTREGLESNSRLIHS